MRVILVGLLSVVLLLVLAAGGAAPWRILSVDVGGAPQHVRLAPLDDDALPDLVFITGPLGISLDNTLWVWRNQGAGRFAPHWRDAVVSDFGDSGIPLEVADLDEDGHADLVLGNLNGTGGFKYRLGDGSGAFTSESTGPSFGGYVDDVSVVDYDLDGNLDVGTTTLDLAYYVDRFDGDGNGGFGSGIPFTSVPGTGTMHLASGDVTGDGAVDDVTADPSGLRLSASFGNPQVLLAQGAASPVIADLDGDGLADVAASLPLANAVVVLRSLGDGDFAPPATYAVQRRPTGLIAVDLDLDGDLDLAVCNSGSRSLSLLENDGAGSFAPADLLPVGSGPVDVAAADVDLDGDPDLVVANGGDETLSLLYNPTN